jgi:hypothetical protein
MQALLCLWNRLERLQMLFDLVVDHWNGDLIYVSSFLLEGRVRFTHPSLVSVCLL